MGIETERKFLVHAGAWKAARPGNGRLMRQGYLSTDPAKTIRVRLDDASGYLTIKGLSVGSSRREYEYRIPAGEAMELLDHFSIFELSKTRYEVIFAGKTWEVDEFHGENEGLIVAEIELQQEDESFELPEWVDREVTDDVRYFNSYLSEQPYKTWKF